jgi:hypothetical protein
MRRYEIESEREFGGAEWLEYLRDMLRATALKDQKNFWKMSTIFSILVRYQTSFLLKKRFILRNFFKK